MLVQQLKYEDIGRHRHFQWGGGGGSFPLTSSFRAQAAADLLIRAKIANLLIRGKMPSRSTSAQAKPTEDGPEGGGGGVGKWLISDSAMSRIVRHF